MQETHTKTRIVVDRTLCDGNGNCAAAAPELFRLEQDDTLKVLRDMVDESQRAKAEAAVRVCPKAALKLVEER